jgi:hypothetical protein
MELMFISKHITSKYLVFVIEFNIILMILNCNVKSFIYSEYKKLINDNSESTSVPG